VLLPLLVPGVGYVCVCVYACFGDRDLLREEVRLLCLGKEEEEGCFRGFWDGGLRKWTWRWGLSGCVCVVSVLWRVEHHLGCWEEWMGKSGSCSLELCLLPFPGSLLVASSGGDAAFCCSETDGGG
jgi:hypothetical protein